MKNIPTKIPTKNRVVEMAKALIAIKPSLGHSQALDEIALKFGKKNYQALKPYLQAEEKKFVVTPQMKYLYKSFNTMSHIQAIASRLKELRNESEAIHEKEINDSKMALIARMRKHNESKGVFDLKKLGKLSSSVFRKIKKIISPYESKSKQTDFFDGMSMSHFAAALDENGELPFYITDKFGDSDLTKNEREREETPEEKVVTAESNIKEYLKKFYKESLGLVDCGKEEHGEKLLKSEELRLLFGRLEWQECDVFTSKMLLSENEYNDEEYKKYVRNLEVLLESITSTISGAFILHELVFTVLNLGRYEDSFMYSESYIKHNKLDWRECQSPVKGKENEFETIKLPCSISLELMNARDTIAFIKCPKLTKKNYKIKRFSSDCFFGEDSLEERENLIMNRLAKKIENLALSCK